MFKKIFSNPEHAAGELRSVLPAELAQHIDWPSLSHCPGTFVDDRLTKRHTDLLFSVRWREGGAGFLYTLFEHQSSCPPLMGYRLLTYVSRIWEHWLAENKNARKLPAIVPVVLFHGESGWTAPTEFADLLDIASDVAPAIRALVPSFRYLVDDLSEVSDEVLRGRAMTALARIVLWSFKHARQDDDIVNHLAEWADVLNPISRKSPWRASVGWSPAMRETS